MKRAGLAIALAVACASCTLLVDSELARHVQSGPPDAGPDAGGDAGIDAGPDAGPDAGCDDLAFQDGVIDGGVHFHSGVGRLTFRGPAIPSAAIFSPENTFPSTLGMATVDSIVVAEGIEGILPFYRSVIFAADTVIAAPGHEGPGHFGCEELFVGSYDHFNQWTVWTFFPGGCGDNSLAQDAGIIPGRGRAAALGIAENADGGSTLGFVIGGAGAACEEADFPVPCIPPKGGAVAASGALRLEGLTQPDATHAWALATTPLDGGPGDVRVYADGFTRLAPASPADGGPTVSFAGPVVALDFNVAIVLTLSSGTLIGQPFDATGALRGGAISLALADPAAHSLEASRATGSAGSVVNLAWLGGDGQAHFARLDLTNTPRISRGPAAVCGSAGAVFAAPLSSTQVAIQIGDAVYVRTAP